MLSLSRQVFLAQHSPRKNVKYVQNCLKMSFLNLFLKILCDVCSRNSSKKRQTTCLQRKKGNRVYWNTSACSCGVTKLSHQTNVKFSNWNTWPKLFLNWLLNRTNIIDVQKNDRNRLFCTYVWVSKSSVFEFYSLRSPFPTPSDACYK